MNEQATLLAPQLAIKGQGKRYAFGGESFEIMVSSEDTGNISILDVSVEPGFGPPLHMHHLEDEYFLIHEGQFAITVGPDVFLLGPGAVAFAPRGIPHRFECVSGTAGRFQLLVTGDNFVPFIKKWAKAWEGGEMNMPAALQALAEHEIDLVQPA